MYNTMAVGQLTDRNQKVNLYSSAKKDIQDLNRFTKKRNSAQASPVNLKNASYKFNNGNLTNRPTTSFAHQTSYTSPNKYLYQKPVNNSIHTLKSALSNQVKAGIANNRYL